MLNARLILNAKYRHAAQINAGDSKGIFYMNSENKRKEVSWYERKESFQNGTGG